jgi:hypothetical protein
MLEATSRALFPTILVFSIYLLLVGHYGPGGGFSAGLVAGLAFVLRYLAGGSTDPGAVVTNPAAGADGGRADDLRADRTGPVAVRCAGAREPRS